MAILGHVDDTSMNKMHKIHFIFKNFTLMRQRGNVIDENVIKKQGGKGE
ncbi:hypothetical protein M493_10025 [Geobacillus genomosp. 3]|uniref:Uncharacterized protein n=1 Tax=Geobacillus genomosp. 3 TaxID=1921421 RepID=S6A2G8_GEOG3|nr:hypothetical protein M493_10025 [Geobacillus genomosp. 3]